MFLLGHFRSRPVSGKFSSWRPKLLGANPSSQKRIPHFRAMPKRKHLFFLRISSLTWIETYCMDVCWSSSTIFGLLLLSIYQNLQGKGRKEFQQKGAKRAQSLWLRISYEWVVEMELLLHGACVSLQIYTISSFWLQIIVWYLKTSIEFWLDMVP